MNIQEMDTRLPLEATLKRGNYGITWIFAKMKAPRREVRSRLICDRIVLI
jgi:hypothetical protein